MEFFCKSVPFLLAALSLLAAPLRAEIQWPQLKYTGTTVVPSPVQVTHAGDGSNRLFIVALDGKIRIFQSGQLLTTPFVDISARISTGNERGLFSVAFPPAYASKRYFYVAYSRLSDGAIAISRFTVSVGSPNVADAASEQVLLVVPHPNDNHNGGQLAFGPDGYLYFGLGDGGWQGDPSNNSQNPNLLLGKLLRLDTESGVSPYAIPPTNPFVGVAGYRSEIWALGLRNPWRFSFDRATGDLYLADVGQYDWEEVNFQPSGSVGGQNYGWRIMEGTHPYIVPDGYDTSTLTPPAIEYSHQVGSSVTGGFVYRGPASRLTGLYVYADFGRGTIWGATREGGVWVTQALDSPQHMHLSSFGEDETGRLYAADYYTGAIVEIAEDLNARTPTFFPGSGAYVNDQLVIVNCATSNVTLRYTTSGAIPTESDPLFPASGLLVSGDTNLKVRAFHPYLSPSDTTAAAYAFSVATPAFSPSFTIIYPETGADASLLSSTANATIRYTLDGSTPTAASTLYTGAIHLNVGPATIRAIAFRTNYAQSAVVTGFWIRPTVATPMINPSTGRIYNGNSVGLSGIGQIHYTLNGTAPTELSPLYSAAFQVTEPMLLRTKSFKFGYDASGEASVSLYLYYSESGGSGGGSGSGTAGYADSSLSYQAQYRSPEALWIDASGTFSIADTGNHAIRQTTAFGSVTTLAGNGTAGFVDAVGTAARFSSPRGICRDAAGNLYVADDGNHVVRKIDPVGNVTTYAGSGTLGSTNGPGPQAQFQNLQGLAIDAAGNLYAGSMGVIRKVDLQRNVSTFATLPNAARVTVAITPDGRIFATDSAAKVYAVSAAGVVSVHAGGIAGFSDGNRTVARFQLNRAMSADALGILYVCDGDYIRKIRPDGSVYTMVEPIAGIPLASLSGPRGLAVGSGGMAWIADTGNHRIRRAFADDWERDGIPDAGEGGTTPFVVGVDDRLVDTDGDGQSNAVEYRGGSDPRDGGSRFEVKSAVPDGAGQVVVQWRSIAGRYYQLDYSDDLQIWTAIGNGYSGTGNVLSVTHAVGGTARRFYKVTAQ